MTRRGFLRAASATSAAYALGCGNSSTSSPGSGPFDVAVVGAGPAGIGAARMLRARGRSVVVLEARDRIGGRAHSDNDSFPEIPVDLGAEWFIQVVPTGPSTTRNPLYDEAIASGRAKELGITADPQNVRFYAGPRTLGTDEQVAEPLATALALNAAIFAYGAQSGCDPSACDPTAFADVSAEEAARQAGVLPSLPWYDWAAAPTVNEAGAPLSELSALDLWLLASGDAPPGGDPDHFLIRSGMGNYISSLGEDLPVELDTPVTSIDWGGSGGVILATPAGTVRAKAVIVTVPMGVLASEQIAFSPGLPSVYLATFDQLPMSAVEKTWLRFSERVFDVTDDRIYLGQILRNDRIPPGVQFNFFGTDVMACIVGGDVARGLARDGRDALVDFAMQSAADLFGPLPPGVTVTATTSTWTNDPYSRGSYTHAVPGGVGARLTLANDAMAASLLGNRVFFAGEACASDGTWLPARSVLERTARRVRGARSALRGTRRATARSR
ncbi:MAG TPA: NAD(P)/FAD-dependent oxidoreductase [Candidatus Binatia bacterium]|nr:NAD(P)/FAD-dependent oxidoreductase [Candidatus Binatia bacterium]